MSSGPERNLVIVHTAGLQKRSDWERVRELVEATAPDIAVRVAGQAMPSLDTRQWQVKRPSLVFSPVRLIRYEPLGGTLWCGDSIAKLDQFKRFRDGGISSPRTVRLKALTPLDPQRWGEFVIVKPVQRGSSRGRMVRLVRTETAHARFAELTLGGKLEMIVQRFIDAADDEGGHQEYRVCTMGARPIYMQLGREAEPRPPLAEIADERDGEIAFNRVGLRRKVDLVEDPEVLDLALKAARLFPDRPCLGIDIVRERGSGQLNVLEVNAGGNVWHMSSKQGEGFKPEFREAMYSQFNALQNAAEALVEKTRAAAS